jgi:hypothetical protein
MRQRPSKQIAHFNEAGENLEREVAMTVDAYFDTFDDFDICDWLLTPEATGRCKMHDLRGQNAYSAGF